MSIDTGGGNIANPATHLYLEGIPPAIEIGMSDKADIPRFCGPGFGQLMVNTNNIAPVRQPVMGLG